MLSAAGRAGATRAQIPEIWTAAGVRGACFGRSKSRTLANYLFSWLVLETRCYRADPLKRVELRVICSRTNARRAKIYSAIISALVVRMGHKQTAIHSNI